MHASPLARPTMCSVESRTPVEQSGKRGREIRFWPVGPLRGGEDIDRIALRLICPTLRQFRPALPHKNKELSQTDTQHMHVEVCHGTRVAHTCRTRASTWIRVRTTWHTPDACLHSRRVGRHQSMELSSCSAFDVTRKSAVFHVEIRPSLVRAFDT